MYNWRFGLLNSLVGDKSYECGVCMKRLSRINTKSIHKLILDTGVKLCEINVFFKRLKKIAHLASHERTHSGCKPCKCDVCNKRFPRKHL